MHAAQARQQQPPQRRPDPWQLPAPRTSRAQFIKELTAKGKHHVDKADQYCELFVLEHRHLKAAQAEVPVSQKRVLFHKKSRKSYIDLTIYNYQAAIRFFDQAKHSSGSQRCFRMLGRLFKTTGKLHQAQTFFDYAKLSLEERRGHDAALIQQLESGQIPKSMQVHKHCKQITQRALTDMRDGNFHNANRRLIIVLNCYAESKNKAGLATTYKNLRLVLLAKQHEFPLSQEETLHLDMYRTLATRYYKQVQ